MKFIIIHGAYGNPEENWFPWLKEKLEEQGHEVFIPKFPTPENQTLEEWMKVFSAYEVDEKTILIGHSLGVPFILSLLEKFKAKSCFLVAGFCTLPENQFKEGMRTFEKDFDYQKIKDNCRKFYIYHSDNDPYVPLEKGKDLAERLGAKFSLVKDAGHLNEKAGYLQFYKLLADIIREICSELPVLKEDERGKIFDSGKVKIIMRKKGTVSGKHSHSIG
ncbi:MAG: alpha/beta hydrolase [Nanoarchaeota archaeon]|nr:alpha/beta hydrolase [Nanoarchaeota archaeon]